MATRSETTRPDREAGYSSLLAWYERNRRDLPWRQKRDPYAIWISEIMLQQTRVDTVLPYYKRFLTRYPSLEDLAAAETDEVLGLWSGLGYYRRARLLHQAARQMVAAAGEFPRDLEGLRSLPGVGVYTAAAVGSIAFGIVEPAIDGNIERVISRYLGIAGDLRRGEARRHLVDGARSLLDLERAGDSNQALMELGATVCRPRKPRCAHCPLARRCEGRRSGSPAAYPTTRARPTAVRVKRRVVVVREEGKTLLYRRPEGSELLAGMWELPWTEQAENLPADAGLARRYGGRWRVGRSLGKVRHTITHRSFEMEVLEAQLNSGQELADGPEAGWFSTAELADLAVSSLVRKVLRVAPECSAVLASREQIPTQQLAVALAQPQGDHRAQET